VLSLFVFSGLGLPLFQRLVAVQFQLPCFTSCLNECVLFACDCFAGLGNGFLLFLAPLLLMLDKAFPREQCAGFGPILGSGEEAGCAPGFCLGRLQSRFRGGACRDSSGEDGLLLFLLQCSGFQDMFERIMKRPHRAAEFS
jgi:hypothetical protein